MPGRVHEQRFEHLTRLQTLPQVRDRRCLDRTAGEFGLARTETEREIDCQVMGEDLGFRWRAE